MLPQHEIGITVAIGLAINILIWIAVVVRVQRMRRTYEEAIDNLSIAAAMRTAPHAEVVAETVTYHDNASLEEINRKYEQLAVTNPVEAGRLKYEECLRIHGRT